MKRYTMSQQVEDNKLFIACIDGLEMMTFLLDETYHVVYLNAYAAEKVKITREAAFGKELGEVMLCRNSLSGKRCGDGQACSNCTIVKLMNSAATSLEAQSLEPGLSTEFTILDHAVDLQEKVIPVEMNGARLFLLILSDRTVEMEKENLQRLFFHDILNTASGLYNSIRLMKMSYEDLDDDIDVLEEYVKDIIEEINYQRDVFMTEGDQSEIQLEWFSLDEMVKSCIKIFRKNEKFKHLMVKYEGDDIAMVVNDRVIIRRVLINLLKNALEANEKGDVITVHIKDAGDYILSVHNAEVILEKHREHIFTKGFSTKGKGRGLGVYGAKLLMEKHSIGNLDFESEAEQGTIFSMRIKKNVEEK